MTKEEKDQIRNHIQDIHLIITRYDGCEISKSKFLNSLENLLERIFKMCC
jgi:hypothetical protein